jgi:predicted N-acyltransferase
MGSPHKARRGFRSIMAPSFHMPFDRRLAGLMRSVLPEINESERAGAAALDEELPFKKRSST